MSERSKSLKVFIYGGEDLLAIKLCRKIVVCTGNKIVNGLSSSDLAIAPYLTKILKSDEIKTPQLGTLIFHPSLLPRHRGRDAIKWTFLKNEEFTGVTWFWADSGIDTGSICEQEIIPVIKEMRFGEYYEKIVIPAMLRSLNYALKDLSKGHKRERPQNEEVATYEPAINNKLKYAQN